MKLAAPALLLILCEIGFVGWRHAPGLLPADYTGVLFACVAAWTCVALVALLASRLLDSESTWAAPVAVVGACELVPRIHEPLESVLPWWVDSHVLAWVLLVVVVAVCIRVVLRWPIVSGVIPLAFAYNLTTVRAVVTGVEATSSNEGSERIVLLTLDTFRADHMSAIGGYRDDLQTPVLDALAARGRLFTQGVAPAPLTLPSHAGMLTGSHPLDVDVVANGDHVPDSAPVIAERLQDAGFTTGAFVSSGVLYPGTGLQRGFDHYDAWFSADHHLSTLWPFPLLRILGVRDRTPTQRAGDQTIARALDWLDAQTGPVFLWVHLYDAHAPYRAPEGFEVSGESPRVSAEEIQAWRVWRDEHLPAARMDLPPPRRSLQGPAGRYASEIAWVDHLVGELQAGLPANTHWVVAADHGESLIEHGYHLNHGRHVFEATIRVPMIVVSPDVEPARIEEPTPSWEVGNTVLSLAGLGDDRGLLAPPDQASIVSFAPCQDSRMEMWLGRPRFEVALRDGDAKSIMSADWSLSFDLAQDADERHPMAASPEVVERGRDVLERVKRLREDQRARRDPEEEAMLRSLGYVD